MVQIHFDRINVLRTTFQEQMFLYVLMPIFTLDIVLFDANEIIAEATFDGPHTYPTGIEAVIVNGVQVIDGERHTDALPGQLLRRRGSELR